MSNAVHITFLLDRSGSMNSIREDVVGGINSFIKEQKNQEGECRLTMAQFDSNGFDYLYVAKPILDVEEMKLEDFSPRGGTPLYDAIAQAIEDADTRLRAMKEPDTQLFVIFTDGHENQSKKFNRSQIFEMIETREGKGWTFTYLGANHDAYGAGAGIGISRGATQTYAGSSVGTTAAFSSLSANTSLYRGRVAAGGQSMTGGTVPFFETKEAEELLEEQKKGKTTHKS